MNRVTGANPSSILGSLQSNGRVFLVNPHGIVFGQGAVIDTAGFIASTLDISDRDFLEGRLRFEGGGMGALRNEGAIRASGDIFLVGPQIENAGLIRSDTGNVLLAAGKSVTISSPDAQGVQFALQAPADSALNLGTIEAKNAAAMFAGTLRHSGDIRANRVTLSATGEAVLEADSIVAASGDGASVLVWSDDTARVHGTISAKGADGKGGFVETSAHTLDVNGIRVDTGGGEWLIDPNDFTIAASGGDITGAALGAALVANSVTIQTTATTASCTGATCGTGTTGNGDIHVNDAVSWSANTLTLTAVRDININEVMTASGTSALAMNTPGGAVKAGMNGSGFTGRVDFPGRSGTGFLTINGTGFTVINSLGAEGSVTGTDLQGINANLSGRYALGSDIDATATSAWNAGAGFLPLGQFWGHFEGLGHTITRLTINRPGNDNVGLFSDIRGTISNVGLVGGSVIGHSHVGGLAGTGGSSNIYNTFNTGSVTSPWNWWSNGVWAGGLVGNYNGTISRSFATGNVTGNYYGYGGLAGSVTGLITDSYATGNVTGPDVVGGLLGNGSDVTIFRTYASGNVTGSNRVGGLIGNTGRIWIGDSYATGTVAGTSNVGGLVGSIMWASVWNTYATGRVTGSSNVGGLVGGLQPGYPIIITNSFWDTETSGQAASAGGTGLTTAQMKTAASLTAFASHSNVNSGTIADAFQVSGGGDFSGVRWKQHLTPAGAYSHSVEAGVEDRHFDNSVVFGAAQIGVNVRSRPFALGYRGRYDMAGGAIGGSLDYARNLGGGSDNTDAAYLGNRAGASRSWDVWRYALEGDWALGRWMLGARLHGQHADEPLIPGEQFGIGGAQSVRGLKEREASGENGHSLSLEASAPLPREGARAVLFVDNGEVRARNAAAEEAASIGAGLRWGDGRRFSLTLDAAHVLNGTASTQAGRNRAHAMLQVQF